MNGHARRLVDCNKNEHGMGKIGFEIHDSALSGPNPDFIILILNSGLFLKNCNGRL